MRCLRSHSNFERAPLVLANLLGKHQAGSERKDQQTCTNNTEIVVMIASAWPWLAWLSDGAKLDPVTVGVALLSLALVAAWYTTRLPSGIPPGPRGLPVLGYLPFLTSRPYQKFSQLAQTYGNVFSMYLGNRLVIVLNDYEVIRESFVKQADIFSGRPSDMSFTASKNDKYNVVVTDGYFWKEHRKFTMTLLRDCGVGKNTLEPLLLDEIQHLCSELHKLSGNPTDFRELLTLSVANNICLMALGKRFPYDDPWLLSLKNYLDVIVEACSSVAMFSFFPWLLHIPKIAKITKQEKAINCDIEMSNELNSLMQGYKKLHVSGQRDHFVNAFYSEQEDREKKNPDDDTFSDAALVYNIKTLLAAGSETTSNTLVWFFIYMMMYPDVQRRVQEELDRVVGRERLPSCGDRPLTPFTEATISEVQRASTLLPLNIPHRNKEECRIQGYRIPKDTYILSNLWHTNNDPKLWTDPENFRPERFLSPDGAIYQKPEHFIPFSAGKRQCLGETLARTELYLYVTSVLQQFTISSPGGAPVSLEAKLGLTYGAKHFSACVVPRATSAI